MATAVPGTLVGEARTAIFSVSMPTHGPGGPTIPARRHGGAEKILARLEHFGVRLGLERIGDLLLALGEPHKRLRAVVVAGTNGKGSTAAWLSSMATAAGYRVGLFTSPHLESPNERIRVNGLSIDDAELERALQTVVRTSEDRCSSLPTYFEALTAAAYVHFVQQQVELAVLEVGLGGRLDATNTADPEVSIVTSISFDHVEHLGKTLGAIAREKAGIFRRDRPALCWFEPDADREVGEALQGAATAIGADLVNGCEVTRWQRHEGRIDLTTARERLDMWPSLPGEHQIGNLVLAVLAAQILRERGFAGLDGAAIQRGAQLCRWPGRLETVRLPGDAGTVLLDAAHNPAGGAALRLHLRRAAAPYDLLFGALRHKQAEATLPPLLAGARRVVLTEPPSDRALPADELVALAGDRAEIEKRCEVALDRCLAGLGGRQLVVCGSLYLVGAVRTALRSRYGVPPAAADVDTSGGPFDLFAVERRLEA